RGARAGAVHPGAVGCGAGGPAAGGPGRRRDMGRRQMTTRIRPGGEAALLLECADLAGAVALARELERLRPDAVDVVPAARTVLVAASGAQEIGRAHV